MANLLAFPRKLSSAKPQAPNILQLKPEPPRQPSTLNHLAMAAQITKAVARMEEEIARRAARTNIHNLTA